MNKRVLAVLAVLAAGVTFAAAEPIVELVSSLRPTWFQSGIYVGTASTSPVQSQTNKLSRTLGTDIDFNFASGTILCDETPAFPLVGAVVGDPCSVGFKNLGTDGGAGKNATFSCFVDTTDTVKVRHCPAGTADDPPDASFCIRIVSHQ